MVPSEEKDCILSLQDDVKSRMERQACHLLQTNGPRGHSAERDEPGTRRQRLRDSASEVSTGVDPLEIEGRVKHQGLHAGTEGATVQGAEWQFSKMEEL